ncbi:hypothetical protein BDM02DRAFT_1993401 [Thelephora ganbajun]|uniref:Uncharacterized protein n=1 Tax=Thelephora ganbajun TaxID=370292 RepID=A0ACB6ZHK7_THEGA|nr:hypothetical protein BDM02DRAFT_1993401 [Thelephora ganbajun]
MADSTRPCCKGQHLIEYRFPQDPGEVVTFGKSRLSSPSEATTNIPYVLGGFRPTDIPLGNSYTRFGFLSREFVHLFVLVSTVACGVYKTWSPPLIAYLHIPRLSRSRVSTTRSAQSIKAGRCNPVIVADGVFVEHCRMDSDLICSCWSNHQIKISICLASPREITVLGSGPNFTTSDLSLDCVAALAVYQRSLIFVTYLSPVNTSTFNRYPPLPSSLRRVTGHPLLLHPSRAGSCTPVDPIRPRWMRADGCSWFDMISSCVKAFNVHLA